MAAFAVSGDTTDHRLVVPPFLACVLAGGYPSRARLSTCAMDRRVDASMGRSAQTDRRDGGLEPIAVRSARGPLAERPQSRPVRVLITRD
jgi:hypothetical protein